MASQNKTNLSTLGSQLTKELNQIRVKNSEKAKEIAFKVLQVAIDNTVVDTSRAISNWQVSVGKPDESFVKAHFYGEERGETLEQSRLQALIIGNDNMRNKKVGESIFITNNIDKAGASEEALGTYDDRIDKRHLPYVRNAEVLEAESEAYTEGLTLAAVANQLAGDK